jgi:hypothetical protein
MTNDPLEQELAALLRPEAEFWHALDEVQARMEAALIADLVNPPKDEEW